MLHNEKAETVLNELITTWISPFGVPEIIFSDAGTIFGSQVWLDWTQMYGVTLCQASVRSLWQSGLCERAIDIAKITARRIKTLNPDLPFVKAMEQAVFFKTCTSALGTLLPPLYYYDRTSYYPRRI